MIATTIRDWLPEQDLLPYLTAIMRVYNLWGRRDNKYKARIKILVHEMGAEAFREAVETEFSLAPKQTVEIDARELARISAYFAPPPFQSLDSFVPEVEEKKLADRSFRQWLAANTAAHKTPGYTIVNASLKPIGGIPGDVTSAQMRTVAELARRYSFDEIRVTHTQNLALPHVPTMNLIEVWERLKAHGLAESNIGLVGDIIACPGLDYCALATARSIPVAQEISRRFANITRQHDVGPLRLNISGCINACGHHHVGHIGILGVDKKGREFYQITLGGSSSENASIGQILGPGFSGDEIAGAVEAVVETYLKVREPGEEFLNTYRRLGAAPFKEALYARH
jgi:sulfite reductase (NADPH) hemoprotein beta-component